MLFTFLLLVIGFGVAIFVGAPLIGLFLALALGRVLALEWQVNQLRQQVATLLKGRSPETAPADARPAGTPASARAVTAPAHRGPSADADRPADGPARPGPARPPSTAPDLAPHRDRDLARALDLSLDLDREGDQAPNQARDQDQDHPHRPQHPAPGVTPARPPAGPSLGARLLHWLVTGNLFLRVGILVLFFGVGFLIRYAVEQELLVFTLTMRLLAIAAGGIGLVVLGGYLGRRRREYGLLLQGAGVGVLYLDGFAAYALYGLLPAGLTFTLLLLIGLATAALAVRQQAPALAWFGFAGGFLAPLLAAQPDGSWLALFGLYALLNGAILAVAWLQAWRALNLLGFGFSFVVFGLWLERAYGPADQWLAGGVLTLFFLYYIAITLLYALRQPPPSRGWVDALLLYANPALTFGFGLRLLHTPATDGAWLALGLGLFYAALAWGLARRSRGLDLLVQALRALAVLFLTIAVPFALSAGHTAGVWALQGAGLVWLGGRQQQAGPRRFGYALQLAAVLALGWTWLTEAPWDAPLAFLNPFYAAAMLSALAALLSAYWREQAPGGPPRAATLTRLLLGWGLGGWLGAGWLQLQWFFAPTQWAAGLLLYAGLSAVVLEAALTWRPWARLQPAVSALPLLGLTALALAASSLDHPAQGLAALGWPLVLGLSWLLLARWEAREVHWGEIPIATPIAPPAEGRPETQSETKPEPAATAPTALVSTRVLLPLTHLATGLLLLLVVHWQWHWWIGQLIPRGETWREAILALPPALLLLLPLLRWGQRWPLGRWPRVYGLTLGGLLALRLVLWCLFSLAERADPAPLPWLPLLNPLELTYALVLAVLFNWWRWLSRAGLLAATEQPREIERFAFGLWLALVVIGLHLTLFRTMHHWWAVPYEPAALMASPATQLALSICWGLAGVGLLLAARARASRPLWMAGAVLLAALVAKLFLIDLAASGTLERVISFLAVGALLMAVGWFAQLPPRSPPRPTDDAPEAEASQVDRTA